MTAQRLGTPGISLLPQRIRQVFCIQNSSCLPARQTNELPFPKLRQKPHRYRFPALRESQQVEPAENVRREVL